MKEQVYENYSGVFADRRAADPKDNDNDDIYADEVPETQVTRSNNGSNTASETSTSGYRCFRLAVFSLLMLVVFLLGVVTILCVKMNNLTIEGDQLETSFNNLTIEKSQLETIFNNLVVERDQLQTRFNNLNMEKSQLQTCFNNMAAEIERLSQLRKDIDTPGWRYFSSSIYYISTEKKSWSESRQDCKERGADLVIINSRDEQDFIGMLRKMKDVWIGANDRQTEGVWKWVDNTTVSTGFWKQGEPNNVGEEDCAVSGYRTDLENWIDVFCDRKYYWICEKIINM